MPPLRLHIRMQRWRISSNRWLYYCVRTTDMCSVILQSLWSLLNRVSSQYLSRLAAVCLERVSYKMGTSWNNWWCFVSVSMFCGARVLIFLDSWKSGIHWSNFEPVELDFSTYILNNVNDWNVAGNKFTSQSPILIRYSYFYSQIKSNKYLLSILHFYTIR